jgi:hypothetical protein
LREVEQRAGEHRVFDVNIYATDQVCGIFFLREVTRRRT